MKKSEKQAIIETYKKQLNYYLLSNDSNFEKERLQGMRELMELFFTEFEITDIENRMIVTSPYMIDMFTNIESWLQTFEKKGIIDAIPFEWTAEGIEIIERAYDWLYSEYNGFKLSIELVKKELEKESQKC